MPTLHTQRVTIRPFVDGDLDAVLDVFDGGESAGHEARASHERWLERWMRWSAETHRFLADLHQPPYGDRAVVLTATGRVIGAVGLVPSFGPFAQLPSFGGAGNQRNTPEVGLFYRIAPDVRGRGYATEAARALIRFAFEDLNLRRVVATTTHDNEPSMAVMRKLGMRIERNPLPSPSWFQIVGILDNDLEPRPA